MNQLFAAYARGAGRGGADGGAGRMALTETDRAYAAFAEAFEQQYLGQGFETERHRADADLGWALLRMLPRQELARIKPEFLARYYDAQRRKPKWPGDDAAHAHAAGPYQKQLATARRGHKLLRMSGMS